MTKIFPRMVLLCLLAGDLSPALADEAAPTATYKSDAYKVEGFQVNFAEPWYDKYHFPHLYALAVGPVFSSDVGESQNFPVINPDTDSFYNYQKANQTQTNGQFELFLGDRWELAFPWKIAAGISYSQTGMLSTKGPLTQGADVLSQDYYSYKYKIQSRQIEVKGRLSYDYFAPIYPYISFGMGAAINTASDFTADVPQYLTLTRSYPSNTQTSFTYTVGLGTEYALNSNVRVGLGYEFSNHGSAALGNPNIAGIPVSGTITQSHLYTHAVMANVSYMVDNTYWWTMKKLTDWS